MKFNIYAFAFTLVAANTIAVYSEPANFDVINALASYGLHVDSVARKRAEDSVSSRYHCATACNQLASHFKSQILPAGTSAYDEWRSQFWSSYQQDALPKCIFQPSKADHVVIAVLLSRWSHCPFAVKSGGHAAMKEASSATCGITIDMAKLNSIVLANDKKIAKIGPGDTWYDVFTKLESEGVSVVGGRVQNVGVGGFLLGGGISLFANERGWACDNVANYELVTAIGAVLHVNQSSYPDLYRSLRGGGPNFGLIHGGSMTYHYPSQHQAYREAHKRLDFISVLAVDNDANPNTTAFDEFKDIAALSDTRKVRTQSDLAAENGAPLPNGMREHYWDQTFRFDGNFVKWMGEVFYEELNPIKKSIEGLMVMLLFQPVTRESVRKMQRNGGNTLPLVEREAPYVIINYAAMWSKPTVEDESIVVDTVSKTMGRIVEEGKRRKLFVDYIYMNYGSEYSDVLASYGPKLHHQLEVVATQVDPVGVFQYLRSGYFKFGGPPRTRGHETIPSPHVRNH
ncbi:hypothetical protein BCR34DRAFT_624945 [Clohesyomyces aquaticus]|uniref:FAD-binding PCMH-type domain-containing protein n=1 Tax=Clohesyomyces aquaticus TaxID=1231657 RepID=A0A1Y1ZLI6_9PLEO|nr:hypothetical protein BCR34DRAFT_624945 [Clohesyomyces aquaticus]